MGRVAQTAVSLGFCRNCARQLTALQTIRCLTYKFSEIYAKFQTYDVALMAFFAESG